MDDVLTAQNAPVASQEASPAESQSTQSTQSTPTTASAESPKVPDNFSQRLELLAKREKAFVQKMQAAKQREADLEKQLAEVNQYKSAREQAKLNPLQALQALGLSYQDLTEFVLNDQKPTADLQVKSLRDELEQFKKSQEEMRRSELEAQRERQEKEAQAAVENFKSQIGEFVGGKSDDYELINLFEGQGLIYETIDAHFQKTGRVMSIKEGADLVEKYLEEQVEKTVETKKFKSKYQTQGTEAQATGESADGGGEKPSGFDSKTLTNSMNTGSSPSFLPAKTESDRIKRALAALGE